MHYKKYLIIPLVIVSILCCTITSSAVSHEFKVRAGINEKLMEIHNNAIQWYYDEEQRLELLKDQEEIAAAEERYHEQSPEKTFEDLLKERFDYVPTESAIFHIKYIAMAEGGNTESLEGIVMLFIAISHRVTFREGDNPRYHFPNTIDEVLSQPGQFSTYGSYSRYIINDKVEQAWEIFLSGEYPEDFQYIQYYDQLYSWSAGGYNRYFTQVVRVGGHYFGGLKQ